MAVKGRNLFHRAHYNIIASQIREVYPNREGYDAASDARILIQRRILERLALNLAKRFCEDRPFDQEQAPYNFDPVRFLNACSPDLDLYPLGELWDEYVNM